MTPRCEALLGVGPRSGQGAQPPSLEIKTLELSYIFQDLKADCLNVSDIFFQRCVNRKDSEQDTTCRKGIQADFHLLHISLRFNFVTHLILSIFSQSGTENVNPMVDLINAHRKQVVTIEKQVVTIDRQAKTNEKQRETIENQVEKIANQTNRIAELEKIVMNRTNEIRTLIEENVSIINNFHGRSREKIITSA